MKKILIVLGLLSFICGVTFAGWTEENSSGCKNDHYVGNLTVYTGSTLVGSVGITGDESVTGAVNITKSAYGVKVSTSATAVNSTYLLGAFATLPTSGYYEGAIAYQTSDHKLYIASCSASGYTADWCAAY